MWINTQIRWFWRAGPQHTHAHTHTHKHTHTHTHTFALSPTHTYTHIFHTSRVADKSRTWTCMLAGSSAMPLTLVLEIIWTFTRCPWLDDRFKRGSSLQTRQFNLKFPQHLAFLCIVVFVACFVCVSVKEENVCTCVLRVCVCVCVNG